MKLRTFCSVGGVHALDLPLALIPDSSYSDIYGFICEKKLDLVSSSLCQSVSVTFFLSFFYLCICLMSVCVYLSLSFLPDSDDVVYLT